ncbi:hypothetical protein [Myxococcus stipitatus]|uniref:hypothetical protein n=1 Tax=Myxococcus stipitatus TaxID=83455 RepID=UPI0030CFDF6D
MLGELTRTEVEAALGPGWTLTNYQHDTHREAPRCMARHETFGTSSAIYCADLLQVVGAVRHAAKWLHAHGYELRRADLERPHAMWFVGRSLADTSAMASELGSLIAIMRVRVLATKAVGP